MLVLLAIFSLVFGGNEHAHEKIVTQLKYFVDPSGIKVIEDILSKASKPSSGIVATVIGVVIALFGASGVFGALQDALNTIWGVKPKPGLGSSSWASLKRAFSPSPWWAACASCCSSRSRFPRWCAA